MKDSPYNLKKYKSKGENLNILTGSILKSQYSIFSMNWEKLTIPVGGAFKSSNFEYIDELGKVIS